MAGGAATPSVTTRRRAAAAEKAAAEIAEKEKAQDNSGTVGNVKDMAETVPAEKQNEITADVAATTVVTPVKRGAATMPVSTVSPTATNAAAIEPSTPSAQVYKAPEDGKAPYTNGSAIAGDRQALAAAAKKLISQEVQHERLKVASTKPGFAIASKAAVNALLVVPFLIWVVSVVSGMVMFTDVPAFRGDVDHIMMPFDELFKTFPLGPAIPFVVLFLRMLSSTQSQPSKSRTASKPRGTYIRHCLVIYVLITVSRWVVYTVHTAVQTIALTNILIGSGEPQSEESKAVVYMSDHIFFGSSVIACLQLEILCAVSDGVKLSLLADSFWRELAANASFILSAALTVCISWDMYFTARHYHRPQESGVALLAGAALYQVPVMMWAHKHWKKARLAK